MLALPRSLRLSVPALAVMCLAVPVSAATIDFDLTGDAGAVPYLDISDASSTYVLHTTPGSQWFDNSTRLLYQNQMGLGVVADHGWDSTQLDGLGPDEYITLVLTEPANAALVLESVTFSRVGYNDEFVLRIDDLLAEGGTIVEQGVWEAGAVRRDGAIYRFVVGDLPAGQRFQFGVEDWNDDYMLTSLQFSEVGGGSGAAGGAIPEPNAAIVFGAGLVIVGIRKRRMDA